MRHIAAILCVVVLMLILDTHAKADTWAVATLTSYHFQNQSSYNQRNLGVGFEKPQTATISVIAGDYVNSHSRTSLYAAVSWKPLQFGDFHFGLDAGAITGYENHPVALVLPAASWERGRLGANLFVAPRYKDAPGVIGLQVKVKF